MEEESFNLNISPHNEPPENKPAETPQESPETQQPQQTQAAEPPKSESSETPSQPQQPPPSGKKASLGDVLKGSFSLYFKNPFLFSGIYTIVMLPVAIINGIFISGALATLLLGLQFGDFASLLGTGGLLLLIAIAVSFIGGLLTLGGTIRVTDNMYEGRKVGLGEALSYAFKKAGTYILLGLRVFWYVFKWVLLLIIIYMIAMALLNTLAARGIAETFTVYAQMIQPGDQPGIISAAPAGPMGGYRTMMMLSSISLMVLNVAIAVVAIIFSLKAAFSFYILFDEENITSKAALKKSLELTKGNLWRIIGYGIVIGLIIGVISYALMYVFGLITNAISYGTAYNIVSVLLTLVHGAIIFPIPVIFFFLFYKGIRKEKGLPDITEKPQPQAQAPA